jgi:hypothetical protein
MAPYHDFAAFEGVSRCFGAEFRSHSAILDSQGGILQFKRSIAAFSITASCTAILAVTEHLLPSAHGIAIRSCMLSRGGLEAVNLGRAADDVAGIVI